MKRLLPFLLLLCSVPSWAALAIDANTNGVEKTGLNCSAASTVASLATTTASANELILAFVQVNNANGSGTSTVASVGGAGLTWVQVVANPVTAVGDSVIFRAFASSTISAQIITATLGGTSTSCTGHINIMSWSGVDTTGTNGSGAIGATNSCASVSGTPTCSLTTTRNASWVVGSLFNFTNSTAPTATSGQTVFGNIAGSTGEYYWSQRQTTTTSTSGTSVPISITAPTAIDYTMVIAEVLPSGGAAPTVNCTIALMGAGPC